MLKTEVKKLKLKPKILKNPRIFPLQINIPANVQKKITHKNKNVKNSCKIYHKSNFLLHNSSKIFQKPILSCIPANLGWHKNVQMICLTP